MPASFLRCSSSWRWFPCRCCGGSLARIRSPGGGVSGWGGHPIPRGIATACTINECIESQSEMGHTRVLAEFWRFLREEQKYWLIPIALVFLLFAFLLVFSSSSPLGPFLYPLF